MNRLRPYQAAAISAVNRLWGMGTKGALVNLPTGTGKTRVGMELALKERGRVVWLADRDVLVEQPIQTLSQIAPGKKDRAGVVRGEDDQSGSPLIFASVQTLIQPHRLKRVLDGGRIGLVICDEAHHSVSESWREVLKGLNPPRFLGLTATLERGDGESLLPLWRLAYSYSLESAIREGHLVRPRIICQQSPELSPERIASAINTTTRGRGRFLRSLCFVTETEEARQVVQSLLRLRIRAGVILGDQPTGERDRLLEAHRAGKLDCLVCCSALAEGYDDPGLEAVVVARSARSKTLYIQMVGRVLRPSPGKKEGLVIDLTGASVEHTLVQAPVLLPNLPSREGGGGGGAGGAGAESSPERVSQNYNWRRLPGDRVIWALGAGKVGAVVLLGVGNFAKPIFVRWGASGGVELLSDQPITPATARHLGEDVARRAGGERALDLNFLRARLRGVGIL